jgi:hypothetical protein
MMSVDADMVDVNILMVMLTPDIFDRLVGSELVVKAIIFCSIWDI